MFTLGFPWFKPQPRRPTDEELHIAKAVSARMLLEELDAIGVVAQSRTHWADLRAHCYRQECERGPQ